jgi:hypothetical protein
MARTPWTPWHKAVTLREDVRSGELSLAIFAADLYHVIMGRAKPVYQDPKEFFALTYPTHALRNLARDVATRLAGNNDKAVRQLALPYGGGKSHTLITLYQLVVDPERLPDLPSVREFKATIGFTPPRARVAALAFDKLDVEKGMEVKSPGGQIRWLRQPWSVLAYQLAGTEGLRSLHADGRDEERNTPPAEPLLEGILRMAMKDGDAVLILVDEVLMYAREIGATDISARTRLADFFQYLTQAVNKVQRSALVASLLAADPRKHDEIGREIAQGLSDIFARQREEMVQPVGKEDVAELLRRRFFTPDSIRDIQSFKPHIVTALKGLESLDEQTSKEGRSAEKRFLDSYPFHPDLTDLFYSKWTQLEGFQKARGILRTFALGLRDAETWDDSILVGPSIFLTKPNEPGLSEAARELATVADNAGIEGRPHNWDGIIQGEFEKARQIQDEFPVLKGREIEQSVFATFLHSQPETRRALTRELLLLIGPSRPDKITLEKALKRWTQVSWFLDETEIGTVEEGNGAGLPKAWRLGFKPNLRQMHADAVENRVPGDLVEAKLLDEIQKAKQLTAGASGAGARVHTLPSRPADIADDGEFHFAILGPKAASDSGKPSAEAKRFLDETTGPDRPRVYRNALVLATPSRDGLELLRQSIRDYLGWEEVRAVLKDEKIDPIREQMLSMHVDAARNAIAGVVQQAYSIVVTISERNEAQAFKISVSGEPLFAKIKKEGKARIEETAVSAEALLPEGPYNLWRAGETTQWAKNLVGAFAQFPHLPKMLSRDAIIDTIARGTADGVFVIQLKRPDHSVATWWRALPEKAVLNDPGLEVVLPEAAILTELEPELLAPGRVPGLWKGDTITVSQLRAFFSGTVVVNVPRNGYEERVTIPKATIDVIDTAILSAVREGKLWLMAGPASIWQEEVPTGVLTSDATLRAPPLPIGAPQLLPAVLPEAWKGESTTAETLAIVLAQKHGVSLPWPLVRAAIDGALRARLIELASDSLTWPCGYQVARTIKLKLPEHATPPAPAPTGVRVARAELRVKGIQDLADAASELLKLSAGHALTFRIEIQLGGESAPPPEAMIDAINARLASISQELKLG